MRLRRPRQEQPGKDCRAAGRGQLREPQHAVLRGVRLARAQVDEHQRGRAEKQDRPGRDKSDDLLVLPRPPPRQSEHQEQRRGRSGRPPVRSRQAAEERTQIRRGLARLVARREDRRGRLRQVRPSRLGARRRCRRNRRIPAACPPSAAFPQSLRHPACGRSWTYIGLVTLDRRDLFRPEERSIENLIAIVADCGPFRSHFSTSRATHGRYPTGGGARPARSRLFLVAPLGGGL